MTVSVFIILFAVFSTITGLCTEAAKKLLDEYSITYSSNVLAFVIACIVGIAGTCVYYVYNEIPFTPVGILTVVLMGIASSIGAMVGYDKVKQTITQILVGGDA